jgi:plasmid stabilization system protein ParE
MSFVIDMRPAALADLNNIQGSLSAYSEQTADRTYALIKDGILSLEDFPRRFALAPESSRATIEIRHLVIGNYRVIYTIAYEAVRVLRIVHAAQKPLDPKELY